jgi:hypothetical protein
MLMSVGFDGCHGSDPMTSLGCGRPLDVIHFTDLIVRVHSVVSVFAYFVLIIYLLKGHVFCRGYRLLSCLHLQRVG